MTNFPGQTAVNRTAVPSDRSHKSPAAVVLLGGLVRPTHLSMAAQRSMLGLPVSPERTILHLWQEEINSLAEALQLPHLTAIVLTNRQSHSLTLPAAVDRVDISLKEDESDYRGTGGVLRDLAQDYPPDQFLLVANGAQVLTQPLVDLYRELSRHCDHASIISHEDGTPSSLMLLRCGTLRSISPVGFTDMKEQGLPAIAKAHHVSVVERLKPTGLPLRTRTDYIHALQYYYRHSEAADDAQDRDPFREGWTPTFGVVEEGADLAANAIVHDSVVLRGGHVGAGAVIVRSVVGPGAVVKRKQMVVDDLVVDAKSSYRRPMSLEGGVA